MDETEVETRHKRTLEKLREKDEKVYDDRRQISRGSSETSGGSIYPTQRSDQRSPRAYEGNNSNVGAREERMESGAGTSGRYGERVRSSDSAGLNTAQSDDRANRPDGTTKLEVELTPEQKAEREKELHRQRQARYEERKKEEKLSSETSASRQNSPDVSADTRVKYPDSDARFQLKSPFKLSGKESEKVKLFTKDEAEESRKALIDLFCKASSIADDIVEIVVKGHEQVQIWAMDEDDAAIFVDAHLKNAQKDQDSARTARILLRVYNKIHTIQYVFSRSVATVRHVKDHGGLSFR